MSSAISAPNTTFVYSLVPWMRKFITRLLEESVSFIPAIWALADSSLKPLLTQRSRSKCDSRYGSNPVPAITSTSELRLRKTMKSNAASLRSSGMFAGSPPLHPPVTIGAWLMKFISSLVFGHSSGFSRQLCHTFSLKSNTRSKPGERVTPSLSQVEVFRPLLSRAMKLTSPQMGINAHLSSAIGPGHELSISLPSPISRSFMYRARPSRKASVSISGSIVSTSKKIPWLVPLDCIKLDTTVNRKN
mmetsp:Transcript_429/g.658  ORF Transcript_429/g.658 Transcript_429/m.658 type:complete len:246 (+) Transcript_429:1059-1796(+)